MVNRKKLDVTEVMVRSGTLGQRALMPPGWEPSAIVTRRIAEVLTKKEEEMGSRPQSSLARPPSQSLLTGGAMNLVGGRPGVGLQVAETQAHRLPTGNTLR